MRERALLIGAELTIAPRASGGTDVRLVVPGVETGS
jgi:two-component system sensor histidine kinase UhpB